MSDNASILFANLLREVHYRWTVSDHQLVHEYLLQLAALNDVEAQKKPPVGAGVV